MKKVQINEMLNLLDKEKIKYIFVGNREDYIEGYSSLYEYQKGTMTWVRNANNVQKESVHQYRLMIMNELQEIDLSMANYIKTNDPHRAFFIILKYFYEEKKLSFIGANNQIDDSAFIGNNCTIGNNCVIGKNVSIGDNSKIYNNVVINDNTIIGDDCIIKSGAVIGEEGFGFMITEKGNNERVPHLGKVVIKNNVEIGANTCIDRGVMKDTIIEDYAKIDNLCHIAHNTKIGNNTMVVALTLIGGSTKIGDNCWIGTSTIRNLLNIGNNSFVGIGSNVVKNVEDGSLVYGNPAKIKGES